MKFLFCALLLSSPAFATAKTHKPHNHGAAQLDIASEGKQVTIKLDCPGMNIYGFEHEAKSETDKKKVKDTNELLEKKASEIFVFDSKLSCKISNVQVKAESDEPGHNDVNADFTADCAQPVAGTNLQIKVKSFFPTIASIHVQYIGDAKQTGMVIKKPTGQIGL